MHIVHTDLEIQREPFARPFGFKGAAFHEKWNLAVRLRDDAEHEAFGLGGLAVLWADGDVFLAHTEVGGNVLMTALLEYALQQVKRRNYTDPMAILADLLPQVHDYGKTVTHNPNLRLTFSLISLVALDNAAWMLYAKENGIDTFDDLIPFALSPLSLPPPDPSCRRPPGFLRPPYGRRPERLRRRRLYPEDKDRPAWKRIRNAVQRHGLPDPNPQGRPRLRDPDDRLRKGPLLPGRQRPV